MADFLVRNGTSIILADATDHSPTAGVSLLGTRTDQIDLTSLAAGAYRQSDKFDFLTPRADSWIVRAAFEWSVAPVAGETVNIFIGFSDNVTAANSNSGNLSGSDAAYVGYGAAASDADEANKQLVFVGSLVATNDADTQVAEIGFVVPTLRYGMIVVQNGTSQALIADAVEMSIHLIPLISQS